MEAPTRLPYISATFLLGGIAIAFWGISDLVQLWDNTMPDGFMADFETKYNAFASAHPELTGDALDSAFRDAHPELGESIRKFVVGHKLQIVGDAAMTATGALSALGGTIGVGANVVGRIFGTRR